MRIKLWYILPILLIMFIGHFGAVSLDLYAKTTWAVDGPLHFLGGVMLGMFWLWVLQKTKNLDTSQLTLVTSIIGFALFGSILWEVFEFSLSSLLPALALEYKLFSPGVSDLLSDILFGFSGGVIIAVWYLRE